VRETIRLLLADDHTVVRAGLRAVLSSEPDLEVVAEVATAEEAVSRSAEGGIDVVLMDLQFGSGMDGATATGSIMDGPDPPGVLVLTTYDTDADILSAIDAGAVGYLLKDSAPEDLVAAIRDADAGRRTLAPAVAQRLMERMQSRDDSLSPREMEIVELVAEGLSNGDIARNLHLSRATVKSHLVHIFTKLGVGSRTAAVAEARRRGLIRR